MFWASKHASPPHDSKPCMSTPSSVGMLNEDDGDHSVVGVRGGTDIDAAGMEAQLVEEAGSPALTHKRPPWGDIGFPAQRWGN
jgi:hypothetical protein